MLSILITIKNTENKTLTITNFYRAPSRNKTEISEFFDIFDNNLLLHKNTNKDHLIFGDMNINILNTDDPTVNDYMNIIKSSGFFMCSSRATRSNTCIDHCIVNKLKQNIKIIHFKHEKLDHDIIFY